MKLLHSPIALFLFILFPLTANATKMSLMTTHYPPFNMFEDGEVIGLCTEIVKKIFSDASIPYELRMAPFKRAQLLAANKENFAIFSLARSKENEHQFIWIGPLVEDNWALFSQQDKTVNISSLGELKGYKVGGLRGSSFLRYLQKNVSTFINESSKEAVNLKKLALGRIDIWATSNLVGPYFSAMSDVEPKVGIKKIYTHQKSTKLYLAINPNSNPLYLQKLQQAFDQLNHSNWLQKTKVEYENRLNTFMEYANNHTF